MIDVPRETRRSLAAETKECSRIGSAPAARCLEAGIGSYREFFPARWAVRVNGECTSGGRIGVFGNFGMLMLLLDQALCSPSIGGVNFELVEWFSAGGNVYVFYRGTKRTDSLFEYVTTKKAIVECCLREM